MESQDSQQDYEALIKIDFSEDLKIDSSSKAKDKTPTNIVTILQEGDEGEGEKHSEKPEGEEITTDVLDENSAELQLQLNIDHQSNASLDFPASPRNFDSDDDGGHAFDLNFPVNDPSEECLNIDDVLGYDYYYGGSKLIKKPRMEENTIQSNLQAGFNEDNGLDLELRIGLYSARN